MHASEQTKLSFFEQFLIIFPIFIIEILFLKRWISAIDSLAREEWGKRPAHRREPLSRKFDLNKSRISNMLRTERDLQTWVGMEYIWNICNLDITEFPVQKSHLIRYVQIHIWTCLEFLARAPSMLIKFVRHVFKQNE